MASEEVCLRWSNFPLNITKNIDDLWKDESLVDVTLCSEGQCIQAHKVILSASSPLFKGIFAVNPCQHPVIILQDVKYRELSSIISFIYKGEVNIEQQNLPELLKAAKTLQIRGLSDSVGPVQSDDSQLRTEQPTVKKRRIHRPSQDEPEEKEVLFHPDQEIVPKVEPEMEEIDVPPDIPPNINDENELKIESNTGENSQGILSAPPSTVNHGVYNHETFGFKRELHFPLRVDKRRRCRVCSLSKIRTTTWYVCDTCRDSKNQEIGLCADPCFALFHV